MAKLYVFIYLAGTRLLFREGRTKGMGRVTEIEPYDHQPNRWQSLKNSSKGSNSGSKLRKRSTIVRRTSRKISFSPRKNVTTSNKKKPIKNHPFFEEQDILVEEELPIAEDILENGTDPNPTDNPLIPEVQEYAGNSVNPVSKLKLFFLFLFFFALLLLLFDRFVSPLSELFWWWGDEFYQTLIFTTSSLHLHLSWFYSAIAVKSTNLTWILCYH